MRAGKGSGIARALSITLGGVEGISGRILILRIRFSRSFFSLVLMADLADLYQLPDVVPIPTDVRVFIS